MKILRIAFPLTLIILIICQINLIAAQADKDVRLLEPGKPIERELAGGGEHIYEVTLTEGQFLDVHVEQREIDVVVIVRGPDDKPRFEKDSPNGNFGLERFALVADSSGTFRIVIRQEDKDSQAGRYLIKINELRPATAGDRNLAEGEKLLAEAFMIRGPGKGKERREALQKAVERFEQARSLFRQEGDKESEMRALFSSTIGYSWIQEHRKAIEGHTQTLPFYREKGDRMMEIIILGMEARNYMDLEEYGKAVEPFRRILAMLRPMEYRIVQATTMLILAVAYNSLNELQNALDLNLQALKIFREVGDKDREDAVLNNTGLIFLDIKDYDKALDYLLQSHAMSPSSPETLYNIGHTYHNSGDYQKALDYYNRGLANYRAEGDHFGEAITLEALSMIYAKSGDRTKAFDLLHKAVSIRNEFNDPLKGAPAFRNIGIVYSDMGEYQKALEYFKQALPLYRAVNNDRQVADVLFLSARVQSELGDLSEARASISESISLVENLRSKVTGQTLRSLYFATVHNYYEFQVDLFMRLHAQNPSERWDIAALDQSERARSRSLVDLLAESGADLQKRIEPKLLERETSIRQSLNARAEEQMRLIAQRHTQEQAASIEKEIRALEVQYQQVEAEIQISSPEYAALSQPVALHRIQTTEMSGPQNIDDKGRKLIIRPLTLNELQQQVLDADTLLLEYSLGDERSYLWAVSKASITSFVLPKRADIEAAARRVYELLTAPNQAIKGETPEQQQARISRAESDYKDASTALSRMILSPASALLGQKRLVIVADGALQYIPFSALPDSAGNAEPLIFNHEITYMPSASALAVLRREMADRKPAAKAVAVLADPVFSRDDPRIKSDSKTQPALVGEQPASRDLERAIKDTGQNGNTFSIQRLLFSRREAEAILAAAPPGSSLKALDFDASRATATGSDLGQYRIVHFATHGLLNSQHPELSGIVLSLVNRQGEPQNGFLRLHDLFNLKLPADLVVLSACQTALGKEIKGEGLVGLTRGFMYAGAARVMASLWKVDDAATAELMKRFYNKVLKSKMRPAAALREAQIEMWQQKRWHAPYNWAAFTLQGDWR
jgi:CHAT domain-containing protein/Tfp pilus assembly protein PilF